MAVKQRFVVCDFVPTVNFNLNRKWDGEWKSIQFNKMRGSIDTFRPNGKLLPKMKFRTVTCYENICIITTAASQTRA